MIISGTITKVGPPSNEDRHGNVYQWITIQTSQVPAGSIEGRIGSKNGYEANTPITVTVEQQKRNDDSTYNYFRRVQEQQVQQQNQSDPQKEMRIVRGNALNAVMSAVEIPADAVKDYLLSGVHFILTGEWTVTPHYTSSYNEEEQPPPDF